MRPLDRSRYRTTHMVAPSACCRSSFAVWTQLSLTRTSLSKRPGVICTMRAEFRRAERHEGLSLPELRLLINEKLDSFNSWASRSCTRWRTLCLLVPFGMFSRTSRNIPEWMGLYTDAVSRFELFAFFTASSSSPSVIWSKICCLPPSVAAPCCQPQHV